MAIEGNIEDVIRNIAVSARSNQATDPFFVSK
jgi:hypothetical protein